MMQMLRPFIGRVSLPEYSLNQQPLTNHLRSCAPILAKCMTTGQSGATDSEDELLPSRKFVDMKVSDFESLYIDDPTGSKKSQIELILKEYEFKKYNSLGRVPSIIKENEMERLLEEGYTPSAREGLLNYLFKREMCMHGDKRRRKRISAITQRRLEEKRDNLAVKYGESDRTGLLSSRGDIIYGLWHNTLFSRIPSTHIKSGNSHQNLIEAAQFGAKIVLDFDFDDYMTPSSIRSCAEQVVMGYGINRFKYREPYDLWFCNYKEQGKSAPYIVKHVLPTVYETGTSMITIKNDCFTKYFDKSNLIYLSPDAKMPLNRIEPDDVLVIGAYNDKSSNLPLTFRKAEKLGIKCRRLPIDQHIAWNVGTKSLCVNHVLSVLLEFRKNGGDWRAAFQNGIPPRKMKTVQAVMELERMRISKGKIPKFNLLRNDKE